MNQEPNNFVARALKILNGDHREPNEEVLVEPAAANARPVYWQRPDGRIQGRGKPEFLARVGAEANERFWIVLRFQIIVCWISSNQLRSRQAFADYKGGGET